MTIGYCDYEFTSPELLSSWDPPTYGGVYAIQFRPDYENKPKSYRCVYFGITNNFNDRSIGENHHAYECWKKQADGNVLHISIHKESNESERKDKEDELKNEYNPKCNKA